MKTLPKAFGQGWLSANARDLIRIMVAFGGCDAQELVRRVALAGTPGRITNTATVEHVIAEMRKDWP